MAPQNVNYWAECQPTGQEFLSYLRNSSHARNYCRDLIKKLIVRSEANSLLEVGVGGLNEYISLQDAYNSRLDFRFTGTDWTPQFVAEARQRFPRAQWQELDITQCGKRDDLNSDIVYSQHVLEHCPGLNPPLTNMLRMANKALINIFFIPPQNVEVIDFTQYPLYHNAYSVTHIVQVCQHYGFSVDLKGFSNADQPGAGECQNEAVLVAVRNEPRRG